MRSGISRWLLWIVVLVTVWSGRPTLTLADSRRPAGGATGEPPRYVRSLETYHVPPVVLIDQEGEQVALDSVLDGDKAVLVNFLFTSCTTTCPVVTATVASMRQLLGPEGRDLRILSISVDPTPSTSTTIPARTRKARPPRPTWRRTIGEPSGTRLKNATLARTRRATAATYGSSPLSTTQPSGRVMRQIVDLTSASSGRVWMPWRSRWSEDTFVSTLASFDS